MGNQQRKIAGTIEPSEFDSASSLPNGSGSSTQQPPQQLSPLSFHHHNQPSDLDQTGQDCALCRELQRKLDLKGNLPIDRNYPSKGNQPLGLLCTITAGEGAEGVDTVDKVSNFNEGSVNGDDEGINGGDGGVNGYGGGVNNGDGEGVKGGDDGDTRGWESNSWDQCVNEGVNAYDGVGGGDVVDDGDGVEKRGKSSGGGRSQRYCAVYMKTGTCQFGSKCKFNHPIKRKGKAFKKQSGERKEPAERSSQTECKAVKKQAGEREEPAEKSGQTECKYYLKSGGCKFGKDCKYNHTKGQDSTPPVAELNFLDLPIRVGKKDCSYYMRNGSCKFGLNCKYNHPDPTTVGGSDPPSGDSSGGSISLNGVSQQSVSSGSSPRTVNETSPFVSMMLSPAHGVSPQSSDCNAYQAPIYQSESSMHPPPACVMSTPAIETNAYMHQQKQMQVDEFPERPDEPECSYFRKTGDCKSKSKLKHHRRKKPVATLPPCNLNDKGLLLRPDKSACSQYTRYGTCKSGPACKFDQLVNAPPAAMQTLDQQFYTDSASVELAGMGGWDGWE